MGEAGHGPKIEQALRTHKEITSKGKALFDEADQAAREGGGFRSAISRAIASVTRRGGKLPSNETGQRFAQTLDSKSGTDDLGHATHPDRQSSRSFLRPGELDAYLDKGELPQTAQDSITRHYSTAGQRLHPRGQEGSVDAALRTHHDLSAQGRKYFDKDTNPEPSANETPKPSEE